MLLITVYWKLGPETDCNVIKSVRFDYLYAHKSFIFIRIVQSWLADISSKVKVL